MNAFGVRALQNNGEDGDNVNAMGVEAGQYNLSPDLNAFGFMAAQNNMVGTEDPDPLGAVNALGPNCAQNNKGSLVNALGPAAGENNKGWSVNVMGLQAGQFNTGSELNAMGARAGQKNTHAHLNAFGLEAGQNNRNSDVNALGFQAGQFNKGQDVNALGSEAARFNWANHTIAIGQGAVESDTLVAQGEGNIGIGYSAGSNMGPGSRNICIGYNADMPDPDESDQINMGNKIIRHGNGIIELKDLIQLTPTTTPADPAAGMIFMDSADNNTLKVYDGASWHSLW